MAKNGPIKTTLLYTLGTIINKAIAFVSIPIFSRLLTEAEYGVLSSFESYVSITTVCVGLAVYETIRNAYVDFNDKIDQYISSIFTLVSCVYIIILFIAFGVNTFTSITSYLLVFLCVTKSFATAITNIVLSHYMMEENIYKRTALLVLPNLFGTILGIISVLFLKEERFLGRIIPMVLILSLLSIYYILKYYNSGKTLYNKDFWKYALTLCLPIIPHGLSVTILASSDRIIIAQMTDMSKAGIYGITYNFGMVAFALITAFESVWIPRFTRNIVHEKKKEIHKEVRIYTIFTAIIIFLILMCAKEVFQLFADKRYWEGTSILPPIIVASFMIHLYSIPAGAEMYYKKNVNIAIASAVAAIINIILNIICINVWGYGAAAYTTVISYGCLFVIHYFCLKKIDPELYPIKLFIPSILIIITGWIGTLIFSAMPILRWGISLAIVMSLFVIAVKKRGIIKDYF